MIKPFTIEAVRQQARERRMKVLPAPKGSVAVHVRFGPHACVVNRGTLRQSMAEARRVADKWIAQWDADNPAPHLFPQAVLRPLTASQERTFRNNGAVLNDGELEADCALIAQTCFQVIRDSDDSTARVQAAQLLLSLGRHYQPIESAQVH
ncbi:hypothetical protein [Zoogloea sp.]|uniref:hypothetical protein n=1 Tax=Zoogloea sp. TaxID=49181 RepID=UPI0025F4594C|nr:hypothetical protein [Zoogloea sp.]MCK6393727.1 hypothetical protein [Zoogloea sp.]